MKHRDIEALFYHANMEQRKKLERDSHKPDFLKGSINESFDRLIDEVVELDEEISKGYERKEYSKELLEAIMAECSDVANESNIMILKCKRLLGDV